MAGISKICFVINAFSVGGAEMVVLNLAKGLEQCNYDVSVLSVLEPDEASHSNMRQQFENSGIKTFCMNLGNFRNPLALARMGWFFRKNRFDIIHAHNRPSDGVSVMVGKWVGIRNCLWTRHSVYSDMTSKQLSRYQKLVKQTPVVIAVSDSVRQNCIEYEGLPSEKVLTIPNGIDTVQFCSVDGVVKNKYRRDLNVQSDNKLLLFVGRLSDHKAPEAWVRLIWKMREKGSRVEGRICGTGPKYNELQGMLDEGPGGVQLLGLRNDIPNLLGAADLFVSTSRVEGLPLNILEAMSVGVPIVAPKIGPIVSLLSNTEYLSEGLFTSPPLIGDVSDSQIDEWAEKVRDVMKREALMKSMGEEGRVVVEDEYSVYGMIKAYKDVFEEF